VIREILLLLLTPVKSVSNQMKTETCHFEQNETATLFVFFSEGRQGRIMKAIIISPYDRNRWNLAFGDVGADLEIDDKAKTNNNDLVKVLGNGNSDGNYSNQILSTMPLNYSVNHLNFKSEFYHYV